MLDRMFIRCLCDARYQIVVHTEMYLITLAQELQLLSWGPDVTLDREFA